MIKNERQYRITKSKRDKFLKSIDLIKATKKDDLLRELMIKQLLSQIETFDEELAEYEKLKSTKPTIISANIDDLPEALIKIRISKGLSQSQLAEKTGMKEQQIQRYEACDYETANFSKVISIAKSMGVKFERTKLVLNDDELQVEGIDQSLIRQATERLQKRKTLLKVS